MFFASPLCTRIFCVQLPMLFIFARSFPLNFTVEYARFSFALAVLHLSSCSHQSCTAQSCTLRPAPTKAAIVFMKFISPSTGLFKTEIKDEICVCFVFTTRVATIIDPAFTKQDSSFIMYIA